MNSDERTRGGGARRRRDAAALLLVVAAFAWLPAALPRAAVLPWGTPAERATAPAQLEDVWRRFEREQPATNATVEQFAAWARALPNAADLDVSTTASTATVSDPGASGWRLEVERAPWAGIDATLAATNLDCVLCHARVDGERLVRVVCATPIEERAGSQIEIVGKIERAPGRLAAPDLLGALDAASFEAGVVSAPRGALGTAAGSLLVDRRLRAVRIDGVAPGPVVLLGTDEEPIRLQGDAVIDGDLVIAGTVVGDGALRVFGNVFVPGDIVHRGSGSLRLLVRGSVLAGDVARPRRGESLPVTGGPDGSFSFLVESLAHFNADLGAAPGAGLFVLRPGQRAPVLQPGAPAFGDWNDPGLRFDSSAPSRVVGPSAGSAAGAPWLALDELWAAVADGRPLGERPDGTRLDALVVASGAFVAVAEGIDTWHASGGTPGDGLHVPGEAPASLRLHGALIATCASIHAPAGLAIRDDPLARSAVRLPASHGLVARLGGPRGEVTLTDARRGEGSAPALSVDPSRGADRLLRPAAQSAATPR